MLLNGNSQLKNLVKHELGVVKLVVGYSIKSLVKHKLAIANLVVGCSIKNVCLCKVIKAAGSGSDFNAVGVQCIKGCIVFGVGWSVRNIVC